MTDTPADPIAAAPLSVQDAIDAFCVAYVQHISATNPGHVIPREQVLRGMLARVFERMKSAGRAEASAWHIGDEVTLSSCSPGLFLFDGRLGFKTEYDTIGLNGRPLNSPEAYVVASGEYFWGGTSDRGKRDELLVREIDMPLPSPPEGGER